MTYFNRSRKWNLIFYFGAIIFILLLIANYKSHLQDEYSIENHKTFNQKLKEVLLLSTEPNLTKEVQFEYLNLKRYELPQYSLNGNEIFIYYAFYDTRDPLGPRIRILVNAVCSRISKDSIKIVIGNERLKLDRAEAIGLSGCHGGPRGHCRLQEMELSTEIYRGKPLNEIKIIRDELHEATIRLHRLPLKYEDGINVCIIGPMFWYNDWPRLLLILERWRRMKIEKLLLFVHSVSSTTLKILNYYVKEGLLEIRPFALMPFTKDYNPNDHSYFSAQHLVTFMCSVWSNTLYTSMNDIDETLFVRNDNQSLFDLVKKYMDPTDSSDIGALSLEHNALSFPIGDKNGRWIENLKSFDFLNLITPFMAEERRNGKYIMKTKYAMVPWIHDMKRFYAGKTSKPMPVEKLAYLHMRNDFSDPGESKRLFSDFEMFQKEEVLEFERILKEIFGEEEPEYKTEETSKAIGHCVEKAMREKKGEECLKPTGSTCYKELKDLDHWVYAKPNIDSHYVVL